MMRQLPFSSSKLEMTKRGIAALTITACLGGCVAATDQGIRVGDATLEQFEAGVTTEAWLIGVLGKPTSQSVVEGVENTHVFRYATSEQISGFASLMAGTASRNTAVTYFIVTNGIVTRFWADRAQSLTVMGGTIEAEPGSSPLQQ